MQEIQDVSLLQKELLKIYQLIINQIYLQRREEYKEEVDLLKKEELMVLLLLAEQLEIGNIKIHSLRQKIIW
jgi:hypothetical protein